MSSLWGEEFVIQPTQKKAKKIISKANNPKEPKVEKQIKSKNIPIQDKLRIISQEVDRILGKYKENTQVIYTREELHQYIDKSIENGIISIDTETNNSLDPITCKIMGACIYTPELKSAYVPVNHVDIYSRIRIENQVTEQDIKEEFDRLFDTKIIMHNGKFDYEVIKCTCDCKLHIDWDTMIAAQVLNENENAKLKVQYPLHIDSSQEKYDIEHLYEGLEYAIIPIDLFALYSATDAYMTYKLYEWQKEQFEYSGNEKLYSLFQKVEMPMVEVVAEMELTGVTIDKEYSNRLSEKYHKLYNEVSHKIEVELIHIKPLIDKWRLSPDANYHPPKKTGIGEAKSKNEQLSDPPDLGSPTQMSILIYDILKAPIVNPKKPRSVGEDELKKINEEMELPLCSLVLEQRGIAKLINTYVDKLPECINQKTGRLHAHFNQMGKEDKAVRTGRMSSTDPNLQNIPSHNNEIRMMFTASPGYIMIGSDYSAQEPRLLAAYSKDPQMIQNYKEKKDLYSSVASIVYNNKYEDNLEFKPDGTFNPDGKARRSSCKNIILGLMYGRGKYAIADQIKGHDGPTTKEDIQRADDIINTFFKNFPKAKEWIDNTHEQARQTGYVEDLWGRRRRLPDIQLNKYDISMINGTIDFNPLLNTKGKVISPNNKLLESYKKSIENCKSKKEMDDIKQKAIKDGIKIKDNSGFIAEAERQSVNARIQGGAASMTKRALIDIYNDSVMKKLGFRTLLPVHDEIIGECPIENVEAAKERLSYLMINAAKPECVVQMKCDADSFKSWYFDVYTSEIKKEYNKYLDKMSKQEALNNIFKNHYECTEEQLLEIIND